MNTFLITHLVPLVDAVPKDEEVKAGWGAFGLFLLMALAVAALGYFLNRQLKTVKRNAEAGVFGPVDDAAPSDRSADQSS